ncbi:BNR-4 repeat-containing protein [Rubellicoccus peritrichatus]|uniref:BNR-4 repeat-containing protein n=1 Tax=Rubellicoccus peritrichatus TaxID=3080537 RepID=A0AAQ3L6T7_9BACT|nr:BNR-4 repeat-containing protein [Puniceicoccus sp. CR14]WOO40071.1 BNR-4 repeat-containing protein [Puniceicoccus sp. CR14]
MITFHRLHRMAVNCYAIALLSSAPIHAYSINNEVLQSTEIFGVYPGSPDTSVQLNTTLAPTNNDTCLTTFNNSTYFVWVGDDDRPRVSKITVNGNTTEFLDSDSAYQVFGTDSHHTFSIGVDQDGYIHVAGDMHNFDPASTNYHTYLSKFSNANIMYWVSDNPEEISSFTFYGDSTTIRSFDLYGPGYCKFYNDRNGELYMLARVNLKPGWFVGVRALGLYAYNTASKTWTARGGMAPAAGWTPLHKCILWEDDGSHNPNASIPAYQGFMATLTFDMFNRMHLAATICNNTNSLGATHVIYAYSDNGGQTFHRGDGTPISPLPMRAEAGSSQADIVHEGSNPSAPTAAENTEYFWNFAGIYLDGKGNPSISFRDVPNAKTNICSWDSASQSWGAPYLAPTSASNYKLQNLSDPAGIISYLSDMRWGEIRRGLFPQNTTGPFYNYATMTSADRLALREEGVYRMVHYVAAGDGPDGNNPFELRVIDLKFVNNGSLTREYWTNVSGGNLESLQSDPDYPHSPDISEIVASDLETTPQWGNTYGCRLRGMLHPPESGYYTFYISGDNEAEFWLSENATIESASKVASIIDYSFQYQWYKHTSQQSAQIYLEAGKQYYFEAIYKEAYGGDHIAVGWRLPSAPPSSDPVVISGQYLSPWLAIHEGALNPIP